MVALSLKISIGNVVKTMQFEPSTMVYDACRMIRERVPEAQMGQRKSMVTPSSPCSALLPPGLVPRPLLLPWSLLSQLHLLFFLFTPQTASHLPGTGLASVLSGHQAPLPLLQLWTKPNLFQAALRDLLLLSIRLFSPLKKK